MSAAEHLRVVVAGIATAAAAIATSAAVAIPTAEAATMGTPIGTGQFARSPNSPYDCTQYDTRIGGVFPITSPTGAGLASSCIWLDTPVTDPASSFAPQAYGVSTVTQVRVAVGHATGPMEAVVMRGLYENTTTPGKPLYACCLLIAASAPFTPNTNGVTAVNVSLPMQEDPTPPPDDTTTIAVNDVLALAVLEPGVPAPMYDVDDQSTVNFLWNTATPSAQTPSFFSDTYGFHVAMDADYAPAAAAAHVGHPTVARFGTAQTPRLSLLNGVPNLTLAGACPIAALCLTVDGAL